MVRDTLKWLQPMGSCIGLLIHDTIPNCNNSKGINVLASSVRLVTVPLVGPSPSAVLANILNV